MKNCIRIILAMMLCLLAHQWGVAGNHQAPSSYEQSYEEEQSLQLSELHSVECPMQKAYKHLRMQSLCLETCLTHHISIKYVIKQLNKIVDLLIHQQQTYHSVIHFTILTLFHPVDYYVFGLKRILI